MLTKILIVGLFLNFVITLINTLIISDFLNPPKSEKSSNDEFDTSLFRRYKSYSDLLDDWDGKIRIRKRTDRHFKHQNCRKNLRKTKRNSNV